MFFNVWQSDMVGQYDVEAGCVVRWVDFSSLLQHSKSRCCTARPADRPTAPRCLARASLCAARALKHAAGQAQEPLSR